MSLGPRRNFRNMGFHFLTPIFHFLSKPEPNEKLVAYSMKTCTWTRKIIFDKNSKKFSKENCKKPNLVCQNWVLTKKYWLNFLELPFSRRHRRPETRPDLPPKTFLLFTGYLALVCTYPEWILKPEAKVISLPRAASILAHLCLTVALQHLESALGYPTVGCRVKRRCVGYPSTPLSNCQPTANRKCARPGGFTGRWVPGRPRVGI